MWISSCGPRGRSVTTILSDDPAGARSQTDRRAEFKRGDWHAAVVTRTVLTSEGEDWRLHATLDAYEGDTRNLRPQLGPANSAFLGRPIFGRPAEPSAAAGGPEEEA